MEPLICAGGNASRFYPDQDTHKLWCFLNVNPESLVDEQTKQRVSLKVESLKMLKEWSVWLIAIQAGICTFLWPVLKELSKRNPPPHWYEKSLYAGWFAFSVSLVLATLLVSQLPSHLETVAERCSGASILSEKIPIAFIPMTLKTLLVLEHVFFLAGLVSVIVHVAQQAICGIPNNVGLSGGSVFVR